MNMFASKYINNSRIVSGTVTVFNSDVILLCNTSVLATVINLPTIASAYFNTQWALYIIDNSSNSAVNTITINPGSGQTINGSSSPLVISTNGAICKIVVGSNSAFLAAVSTFGSGGGYYQTVQDEGVSVTQRAIMNFVGSGVTVTDAGGKTVVTIPGGVSSAYDTIQEEGSAVAQRAIMNFIGGLVTAADDSGNGRTNITVSNITSLTNSQVIILINSSTIIPGMWYLITDGGISNGGVIVLGVTTSSIETFGGALFFNADYQDVNSPVSLGSNLGIWSSESLSVSINDFVIYNNKHYKNLTGAWGTAPSGDAINWLELSKSVANGYVLECDYVRYNVDTNTITHRADRRGNEVDSFSTTLTDFQWGRDACTYNKVMGLSTCAITNSWATIRGNIVENGVWTDTTKRVEHGIVSYNMITSSGSLTAQVRGTLTKCIISNSGVFSINLLDTGNIIGGCEVSDGNTVSLPGTTNFAITNKKIRVGYSNWELDLDFSDGSIYTAGALIIPSGREYVGVFTALNCSSANVTSIVNAPTNHRFIIRPENGEDLDLLPTAVGSASADQIISESIGGLNIIGRTNGCDQYEFERLGTFVGVVDMLKWS